MGMVYCRFAEDGTFKSSVDKFYDEADFAEWAKITGAQPGTLFVCFLGILPKYEHNLVPYAWSSRQALVCKPNEFALYGSWTSSLEWDEETQRYHAMHHPFTSPKPGS